ncbi:TPA: hypothetical protein JI037_07435 [Acinetobacter baumannii]|uniref:hypothetical protein n=1 Tax=Acinetobacter baumannii TaxID=470 RepID=UPI0029737066|nr:hypothetical protein [Acinetobacter baumannii]HAV5323837.1 hypothetical protein [Acinetobacter baumannii]HCH7476875.1 hypothetical protein [Acinetobacter baumannii]
MIENPITFNASMIRALLAGRKTQTRRVIKPQPTLSQSSGFNWKGRSYGINSTYKGTIKNFVDCFNVCPYGMVGDQLFVQETYGTKIRSVGGTPHESFAYKADNPKEIAYYDCHGEEIDVVWKYPSEMPHSAARIFLEITNVFAERLHQLSEEDALKEGIQTIPKYDRYVLDNGGQYAGLSSDNYLEVYQWFWEESYGQESWNENPWVWVIEFKVIQGGAS